MHDWPQTGRQWQAVRTVYEARWRANEQVGRWMRQARCPERCFAAEDADEH